MIILKYVQAERFRLLRDVSLHFPQRGSILVSGPNEAGKSTLIESIYFALYGEPLAAAYGKRAAPSLNELIRYGEEQAIVSLTLSIGAKELSITRTIERDKGQRISLDVRQLGMPAEKTITNLKAANERIIAELGYIDGKTLRNSCLRWQRLLLQLAVFGSAPVTTVGTGKHPYTAARSLDRGVRLAESARPAVEVVPANVLELVAGVRIRKPECRIGPAGF